MPAARRSSGFYHFKILPNLRNEREQDDEQAVDGGHILDGPLEADQEGLQGQPENQYNAKRKGRRPRPVVAKKDGEWNPLWAGKQAERQKERHKSHHKEKKQARQNVVWDKQLRQDGVHLKRSAAGVGQHEDAAVKPPKGKEDQRSNEEPEGDGFTHGVFSILLEHTLIAIIQREQNSCHGGTVVTSSDLTCLIHGGNILIPCTNNGICRPASPKNISGLIHVGTLTIKSRVKKTRKNYFSFCLTSSHKRY